MRLTRRQFFIGGAAGLTALSTPAFAEAPAMVRPEPESFADNAGPQDTNFSILNRMAYGPRPETREHLREIGFRRYVEEQLHPTPNSDSDCNVRLAKATLHIEYPAKEDTPAKPGDPNSKPIQGWPAVKEDRPLLNLAASPEDLWKLVSVENRERVQPALEVRAATWIRAVYSEWQLREMMVEFWHNHFNVAAFGNPAIHATFPLYDRMMREHCFGNFRAFLEDIAQSIAMQYFLNNNKSKASPANENYARELFELHTLGADHYYNSLYNRWRAVPGAVKGHPIGYIDQDVYEAARAFTGWTIEDGSNSGRGMIFPKTGKFTYFDGWHDNYQKRVLGTEFDPNTPPMADGRKVLDLVAAHPGTAMYVCTKLCRRFVADQPSQALVAKAAKVWQKNLHAKDQITKVMETILLSPEFAQAQGRKVKRPFEYVVSYLRATGADFTPNEPVFNNLTNTGYRQFDWQTPTGHPDIAEYWLNTNTMLSCWNMLADLTAGGMGKAAKIDIAGQTPAGIRTSRDIIAYWVDRLTGRAPSDALMAGLMQYMPKPKDPNFTPNLQDKGLQEPLQQMAMVIGQLPDFQVR